ncbi:MAG: hypothetical protein L3J89_08455 [Gammaproteobacteria bacterium]|nr:hypothetical protein [Gammaproteobacteria bacterium]
MINRLLILSLALLPLGALHSAEWSSKASIEARHFFNDALNPQQHDGNLSITVESEFYHDWDDDSQRIVFTPFARIDQHDSERSHLDLREFYWRKTFNNTDLYLGIRKIFWGVTESLHLVDIINQSDTIENLDGEDKLGQPMVSLSHSTDLGDWSLYILPWFRERTFAGIEGRLRPPFVVDQDNAQFESNDKEKHIDSALRWSHVIGDWDVGLSYFHGTDRTPQLIPQMNNGVTTLLPYYAQLNQLGLDAQYTYESWLWKLESVSRHHDNRLSPNLNRSKAAVGGFEYTWYGLFDSATDIGLVMEYQYDSREANQALIANNDIAIGSRLTFNDVQDTTLLALVASDLDQRERFISLEGARRLGDDMSVNIEARFFSNTTPQTQLFALRNDDYLELLLTRYF